MSKRVQFRTSVDTIEKLDDVRRLNAGIMSRSGLAPVPGARSARVEFGVLDGAVAVDADPAPATAVDARGTSLVMGHYQESPMGAVGRVVGRVISGLFNQPEPALSR